MDLPNRTLRPARFRSSYEGWKPTVLDVQPVLAIRFRSSYEGWKPELQYTGLCRGGVSDLPMRDGNLSSIWSAAAP